LDGENVNDKDGAKSKLSKQGDGQGDGLDELNEREDLDIDDDNKLN
jgi:hypothetical protein